MIYKFRDKSSGKTLYLTEENEKRLKKLASATYGSLPDNIEILKIYKENGFDSVELVKSFEDEPKATAESEDIFKDAKRRKGLDEVLDYANRHSMSTREISSAVDLNDLVDKWKTIKVLFTKSKDNTIYYALFKNERKRKSK